MSKLNSRPNKPERVFGLQVRCRELDNFKILGIFCECLEIFRIFFRNCCGIFEFFWIFFEFFFEIFREFFRRFFWRNYLAEFFEKNFLEDFLEDFFGGLLGGFFWEEFLRRSSLFTLELTCLSRFWGNDRRKEVEF